MRQMLFIGGPKDGSRLNITDPYRMFVCPVVDDHDPALFKTVLYRLMAFAGEKERYEVYVLDGMTADQALAALLANYHPKLEPPARRLLGSPMIVDPDRTDPGDVQLGRLKG